MYLFVYNPHPSIQLSIYPSTIYSPSIHLTIHLSPICIVYPHIFSTSCLPPSHHSSYVHPPFIHSHLYTHSSPIHPSIHPLVHHPSIHLPSFIYSFTIHSFIHHLPNIHLYPIHLSSIRQPIHPSIHPSTNLSHTYLFIYHSLIPCATIYLSPVHPSTCLFIHPPFIQPSTHHHLSSIHSFIPTYLFTHHLSTNPLSIHHPSIHTSIHYLLIHH